MNLLSERGLQSRPGPPRSFRKTAPASARPGANCCSPCLKTSAPAGDPAAPQIQLPERLDSTALFGQQGDQSVCSRGSSPGSARESFALAAGLLQDAGDSGGGEAWRSRQCWLLGQWPVFRILRMALPGRRRCVPGGQPSLARMLWSGGADPQTRSRRPMNPERLQRRGASERRKLPKNSSRVTLPLRSRSASCGNRLDSHGNRIGPSRRLSCPVAVFWSLS